MGYSHDAPDRGSAASFLDRGVLHAVIGGACGLIFTPLLQARELLPSSPIVTLLGIVVCAGIARRIWRLTIKGAESFGNNIYVPSGDTTAYTPTFSHIEALEARGQLDAAAAAWDEVVAENPQHVVPLLRAGDFHLRLRQDPTAALERYLAARALGSGSTDTRRYIQQKIVDLYLGPLQDDGRAMVELRRLIDAFPGTREADGARAALAELKSRRAAS